MTNHEIISKRGLDGTWGDDGDSDKVPKYLEVDDAFNNERRDQVPVRSDFACVQCPEGGHNCGRGNRTL